MEKNYSTADFTVTHRSLKITANGTYNSINVNGSAEFDEEGSVASISGEMNKEEEYYGNFSVYAGNLNLSSTKVEYSQDNITAVNNFIEDIKKVNA